MTNWHLYPVPNRPVAMGVNGMVASAHPLASGVGVRVLAGGGNAFDAAVATAAALNVVESYMSGVGGIGVGLAYVAREGRVRALNFSGRAPMAAEPSRFTDETKQIGVLASLVPGNVAGWLTLHETYGSMELERLFAPAIDYAENGVPVTHFASRLVRLTVDRLSQFPTSAAIVLDPFGGVPRPGSRLRMPQLAGSLRRIASGGQEAFYRGDLAHRIVEASRSLGGLFTEEDFAEYHAEWHEPLSATYRGFEVFTTPPNCSSFQVLQTLKLMERYSPSHLPFQHADTLHRLMEAVKLGVADRIEHAGDTDNVRVPVDLLLSSDYAARQQRRIDMTTAAVVSGERFTSDKPTGALTPGSLEELEGGMTTHFGVADRDGNVVTITQTLGGTFGSAVAIGDTGIFLNNMAEYFDLDEESTNVIGPGKRVDFVVAPTQTFRDGRFLLSLGTPGGYGILQTTPQMLMHLLDYGMSIQQAIEAPRFRYAGGREVHMEDRFPLHVRRDLGSRGHEVLVEDSWYTGVGGAQGIMVDGEHGVFQGGADPRRDGYAIGW